MGRRFFYVLFCFLLFKYLCTISPPLFLSILEARVVHEIKQKMICKLCTPNRIYKLMGLWLGMKEKKAGGPKSYVCWLLLGQSVKGKKRAGASAKSSAGLAQFCFIRFRGGPMGGIC